MSVRRERNTKAGHLFACGKNDIFSNRTLAAIAEKHGRTIAQIALRFLTQQGIIVIPKSTHLERMKENYETLDFDLETDEINEIEQLEVGRSLFGWW